MRKNTLIVLLALSFVFFHLVLNGQIVEGTIIDKTQIRFDGIYNTYDTTLLPCGERGSERYVTNRFLVFRKNGTVFYSGGATLDFEPFRKQFYDLIQSKYMGYYKIVGDSIYATIPTLFSRGMRGDKHLKAKYKGYIKNKDTIISWQMLRPFPAHPAFNSFFKFDTMPKIQYFIKNDAIIYLDSLK